MVLTQRGMCMGDFGSKMVSIPLWFLRNCMPVKVKSLAPTFPYHYGSYATDLKSLATIWCVQRFHTTMVLTQLIGAAAALTAVLLCFHTTMVLTQLLLLQRYYTGFGQPESNEGKALTRVILSVFWRFVWIRFEKS